MAFSAGKDTHTHTLTLTVQPDYSLHRYNTRQIHTHTGHTGHMFDMTVTLEVIGEAIDHMRVTSPTSVCCLNMCSHTSVCYEACIERIYSIYLSNLFCIEYIIEYNICARFGGFKGLVFYIQGNKLHILHSVLLCIM